VSERFECVALGASKSTNPKGAIGVSERVCSVIAFKVSAFLIEESELRRLVYSRQKHTKHTLPGLPDERPAKAASVVTQSSWLKDRKSGQ